MEQALKDPRKVKAGTAGAQSRWGERRIARLDQLNPAVADVIRALIRADEAARRDPEAAPST